MQNYYHSLTNEKITLKEIVARYDKGDDDAAKKTMERLVHFFGKAVSVVTNLLDPDVIVIGGGVGNIDLLYKDGPTALGKFIFNNRVDVKILKPSLGDSAGVLAPPPW